MSLSIIRRFNTHDISDEAILASFTGRESERQHILEKISDNLSLGRSQGQLQHLLIRAPRGFGKSFMARLAEIDTNELAKKGRQVQFALLPEEQRNVKRPSELLKEINRILKKQPWNQVTSLWEEDDEKAWDQAVTELDATIDNLFAVGDGLVIAALENFDSLLTKVFKGEEKQKTLRKWMTRKNNRVMLLATTTDTVDLDYNKPIYQAFNEIALDPWTEGDCIDYFNRLRTYHGEPVLNKDQEAKARAIANFIGGNPRLARLLGDVLNTHNALTVTQTLDALVDEFADYYRRRIDDLGEKAQVLVDTLIRSGEPRAQSELAELAGTTQSRIARAFSELQQGQLVTGQRATNSRETLYRMTDRVFVHFYRTRYGGMTHETSPLSTIMDFLESFFSHREASNEAERLLDQGHMNEGRVFVDIAWAKAGKYQQFQRQVYQRYFDKRMGLYLKAVEIKEEKSLTEALEQFQSSPEKAFQTARQFLSGQLNAQQAVLWLVFAAHAATELSLSSKAEQLLNRAVSAAESVPDLMCIAHRERANFYWYLTGDKKRANLDNQCSASQADKITQSHLKVRALNDKSFSFYSRNKYEEAIETAQRAAFIADQINDKSGQAEALRHAAYSLGHTNRHEEAIATARKAILIAEEINKIFSVTWAIKHLLVSARHVSLADCVELFSKWLELTQVSDQKDKADPRDRVGDLFAATTRAGRWSALLDLWRHQLDWFEDTVQSWHLEEPGKVLVDIAANNERAEAYATAVEFIDAVAKVLHQENEKSSFVFKLQDLIRSSIGLIAQKSDDFGFMGDLVSLVQETFAAELFANEIALLKAAVNYHKSGRDPAALEREDPDIVIAIKRVWDKRD